MPNSNNIMEFCCYHDYSFIDKYDLYEFEGFKPYYGGNDILNPYLNEFTMYIYIKNNIDTIKEDFIGCSHYRRRLWSQRINEKLDEDTLYWNNPEEYNGWIKGFLPWACSCCDIDIIGYYNKYAEEHDKEMIYDASVYDNIKYLYMRECCIMHKKYFVEMVNFIEGFWKYLFQEINFTYNRIGFHIFCENYVWQSAKNKNVWCLWWDVNSRPKHDIPYKRFCAYITEGLICHWCTVKFGNNCRIIKNGILL